MTNYGLSVYSDLINSRCSPVFISKHATHSAFQAIFPQLLKGIPHYTFCQCLSDIFPGLTVRRGTGGVDCSKKGSRQHSNTVISARLVHEFGQFFAIAFANSDKSKIGSFDLFNTANAFLVVLLKFSIGYMESFLPTIWADTEGKTECCHHQWYTWCWSREDWKWEKLRVLKYEKIRKVWMFKGKESMLQRTKKWKARKNGKQMS